jgi:Ser/Thr protein kinase RdoA (MazF antagonist)
VRGRGGRTEEVPLSGGATAEGVVRVGDTVRKPPHRRSQLMRDVLLHLERAGFDAAPRWLGVDAHGRDVLSWIEGETFTDRSRMHPYIGDPPERVTFSDGQLAAVMRLLRRYHDSFVGEVICHGDFGPWNIVWREGMPFAVIDFDDVHAGEAAEDVAYALRMFVGYGFAAGEPAELARRTGVALGAYGAGFDVPAILEREHDLAEERCRRYGWDRQLAKLPVERAWLEANRALLRSERLGSDRRPSRTARS